MALVFLFFREKKEKSLLHHMVTCLFCVRKQRPTLTDASHGGFACARRAAPDFLDLFTVAESDRGGFNLLAETD
jgi:hypothetical protein